MNHFIMKFACVVMMTLLFVFVRSVAAEQFPAEKWSNEYSLYVVEGTHKRTPLEISRIVQYSPDQEGTKRGSCEFVGEFVTGIVPFKDGLLVALVRDVTDENPYRREDGGRIVRIDQHGIITTVVEKGVIPHPIELVSAGNQSNVFYVGDNEVDCVYRLSFDQAGQADVSVAQQVPPIKGIWELFSLAAPYRGGLVTMRTYYAGSWSNGLTVYPQGESLDKPSPAKSLLLSPDKKGRKGYWFQFGSIAAHPAPGTADFDTPVDNLWVLTQGKRIALFNGEDLIGWQRYPTNWKPYYFWSKEQVPEWGSSITFGPQGFVFLPLREKNEHEIRFHVIDLCARKKTNEDMFTPLFVWEEMDGGKQKTLGFSLFARRLDWSQLTNVE